MSYACKVIADSIGPSGCRITTLEVTYPLMVHAEHLRHRVFSFSVASNRAIPTRQILAQVISDPVVPVWFGKNQPGMSAREELIGWRHWLARKTWLAARWPMITIVWLLLRAGLHKQLANRLLSPWQWVTLLVTGTEWDNFFALRCHPDAQPEMRRITEMMRDAMTESKPRFLRSGEWHLPMCDNDFIPDPRDWATLCLLSTARCARVSMTKHVERRSTKDEIAMAEKLIKSGHYSPTEHAAQALPDARHCANYRGWLPFRKTIPNEGNFAKLGGT